MTVCDPSQNAFCSLSFLIYAVVFQKISHTQPGDKAPTIRPGKFAPPSWGRRACRNSHLRFPFLPCNSLDPPTVGSLPVSCRT
jgi:hypothetical protein